jgi:hypothetical protein
MGHAYLTFKRKREAEAMPQDAIQIFTGSCPTGVAFLQAHMQLAQRALHYVFWSAAGRPIHSFVTFEGSQTGMRLSIRR